MRYAASWSPPNWNEPGMRMPVMPTALSSFICVAIASGVSFGGGGNCTRRPAAGVVQVSVHQSGDHRAAAEIDLPGRGPRRASQRFAVPHCDKAIAADRHRLRDRELRVDG